VAGAGHHYGGPQRRKVLIDLLSSGSTVEFSWPGNALNSHRGTPGLRGYCVAEKSHASLLLDFGPAYTKRPPSGLTVIGSKRGVQGHVEILSQAGSTYSSPHSRFGRVHTSPGWLLVERRLGPTNAAPMGTEKTFENSCYCPAIVTAIYCPAIVTAINAHRSAGY
jgi:hypothetical protein